MYASSACEKVFHVDPDHITGTPILLYIRADDLAPFVEQIDLIKTTAAIVQMRFWFQSPNWPREIPCEAIVFGSVDGIVAVVRRCKPFVRKYFIGSREQFECSSHGSSSLSSEWTRSFGSTPASELSASSSPPPRNISRESLNQIKIFELDPNLVPEGAAMSGGSVFKKVFVQDYEEEGEEEEDDCDDVDTLTRDVAISKLDDGDVGF